MREIYNLALFIFRRDLRLEDNTGLIYACAHAKVVLPCFIFTPEQIERNPYRSDRCLQFMIESLQDLEEQLKKKKGKLYLFYGKPEQIIRRCISTIGIDAVIFNRDYTPYSLQRDQTIEGLCQRAGISFHSCDDALLHPLEETLKADGKPYTLFTPYFRKASKIAVPKPASCPSSHYYQKPISFAQTPTLYRKILAHPFKNNGIQGGRKQALAIVKNLQQFSLYERLRDIPAEEGTTRLSAHLKFTTCSPREVYWALCHSLGRSHPLIRQLYWRDFFTSLGYFFPRVFKEAFHSKFNHLRWNQNKQIFKRWCEGKTGFPIVDAGMRQLKETGWMHNRVRMIAASLLVKTLHLPWQWGEKYFAQTLIDYDPAVNNGNWQWVASTGADAQPYFRIFNPWNQQKKFDSDCAYIKHWLPELRSFSPKQIHEASFSHSDYPAPIADHDKEAKIALTAYRSCANRHSK